MKNSKLNYKLRDQLLLYAVSDRSWADRQTLIQQIEAALKGGITMLQLREKDLPQAAFLHEALEVRCLTRQFGVPLIINDNLEIACQSGADGLHIGQHDCPVHIARKILGPNKILGVSAQTTAQAIAAEAEGADYLGVGAVFNTSTKSDADQVSLRQLAAICRSVQIPVVAIGGINTDNIPQLANTGIIGAAIVSAIFAQTDIEAACRNLKTLVSQNIYV